jgi:hypothetical protein
MNPACVIEECRQRRQEAQRERAESLERIAEKSS